jgi:hypothetical protein
MSSFEVSVKLLGRITVPTVPSALGGFAGEMLISASKTRPGGQNPRGGDSCMLTFKPDHVLGGVPLQNGPYAAPSADDQR